MTIKLEFNKLQNNPSYFSHQYTQDFTIIRLSILADFCYHVTPHTPACPYSEG